MQVLRARMLGRVLLSSSTHSAVHNGGLPRLPVVDFLQEVAGVLGLGLGLWAARHS